MKKKEVESTVQAQVTRAKQFDDGGVMFDMVVNGVSIYGCRVVEGKNGDFVSFPSYKAKDGKYYSHAYIKLSDADTKNIVSQVEDMI